MTGAPVLTGLRIEGPAQVSPGDSPRYAAVATYSDGSTTDVTETSLWSPTGSEFSIHFTSSGVAAPAKRGEALVAAHAGQTARLHVLVLEAGTFKLSGSVVSETGGGPLSGATVEVLSGTGQGLRTVTSGRGEYALYGVAGPVRIRASLDGFTPQIHERLVTANDSTDAFPLAAVDAPAAVGGVWTMTVAPSRLCPPGLPDTALGRTYNVALVQSGTHMTAAISSPTLDRTIANLPGTVFGSRVQLSIWGDTSYGDWTSPDVIDRLSPIEFVGFVGVLVGTLAGDAIRGTLDGDLGYWRKGTFEPTWYCPAKDHAITLSR